MQDQDRQEQVAAGQTEQEQQQQQEQWRGLLPHLPNFFPACSIPHWAVGSGQWAVTSMEGLT